MLMITLSITYSRRPGFLVVIPLVLVAVVGVGEDGYSVLVPVVVLGCRVPRRTPLGLRGSRRRRRASSGVRGGDRVPAILGQVPSESGARRLVCVHVRLAVELVVLAVHFGGRECPNSPESTLATNLVYIRNQTMTPVAARGVIDHRSTCYCFDLAVSRLIAQRRIAFASRVKFA